MVLMFWTIIHGIKIILLVHSNQCVVVGGKTSRNQNNLYPSFLISSFPNFKPGSLEIS